MDETDICKRQGLGGTLAAGVQPALLVVDFGNGFTDPEILCGGNARDAAEVETPFRRGDAGCCGHDRARPGVFGRHATTALANPATFP